MLDSKPSGSLQRLILLFSDCTLFLFYVLSLLRVGRCLSGRVAQLCTYALHLRLDFEYTYLPTSLL